MYDFQSTYTLDSKTCEGIRVVFHRFTSDRRRQMRVDTADLTAKLRDLARDRARQAAKVAAISQSDPASPLTIDQIMEMAEANMRIIDLDNQMDEILRDELHPKWIEWGVVAVEGLTINGQPSTLKDIGKGPEPLYEEILLQLQAELGLTDMQRKNSPSLSTSQQQVDGESKNTTAPIAEKPTSDSTSPATAPSTSQVQ